MFSLNEGNRFVVCLNGVDLRRCVCVSEQEPHHHEVATLGARRFCNLL